MGENGTSDIRILLRVTGVKSVAELSDIAKSILSNTTTHLKLGDEWLSLAQSGEIPLFQNLVQRDVKSSGALRDFYNLNEVDHVFVDKPKRVDYEAFSDATLYNRTPAKSSLSIYYMDREEPAEWMMRFQHEANPPEERIIKCIDTIYEQTILKQGSITCIRSTTKESSWRKGKYSISDHYLYLRDLATGEKFHYAELPRGDIDVRIAYLSYLSQSSPKGK